MATLLLSDEEAARVKAARARAHELGLSKTELAARISRGRQNVTEVLNGTTWSPGTLALIEEELGLDARATRAVHETAGN